MSRLICTVNDKIVAQTMEKLNTCANSIKEDEHIHEALKQNRDYQRPDFSKSEKEEQVKESVVDHDSMLADNNSENQDMISGKPTSSLKLEEDKSQTVLHRSNDRRTTDEFTDTGNKDSKKGIESIKSDSKSEKDSDFDDKGVNKDTNCEKETIKRESGISETGTGGKDTSLTENVLKHCSSDCVPDLTVDEHDEAVNDDVKMEDPAVDKTKSSNKVEWTLDDTEPVLKVRPKQTTVYE